MSDRKSIRASTRAIASATRLAALGIATAVASLASPAQADFYSLAGRFECLAKPEGSCGGPGRAELLPPPASKPAPKQTTAAVAPSQRAEPQLPQQQPTAPQTQASASRARGPIETIAAAVRRGQVSAEDRATLQRLSKAGNAQATELLAWCDYKGIGTAPDPVAAYVLYGIAALAGMPTARQNQAVIYEYSLTSEQRQKVLEIQNEVLANP
jgi:TPR repeat protein